MPNISIWEILLLLLVLLLVFGPKRLPEMGRSLGRGMREFRDSLTGRAKHEEQAGEQVAIVPAPGVESAPAPTAPSSETEPVSR